jgi:predicted PurR-regulated permease PerM
MTEPTLRHRRPILFWTVLAVAILAFLYLVRGMLLPFAVAIAVAYFFNPLARRLQRYGWPRWLSTALILGGFGIVFVGVLFLIVPILEKQIGELIAAVPGLIETVKSSFMPRLNDYINKFGLGGEGAMTDAVSSYGSKAVAGAGTVLAGVWSSGLAVLDLLSLLLITPVIAFYLLRDWQNIMTDLDSCLPRKHLATLHRLFHDIDNTLSGFIRGQALVCLIQATYYAIALSIAGLNFGALVGVATGILTFIPYLGATIGLVTGIAIAIAEWHNTTHVLIIAGLFAVGQILESNVITPALVGGRIGLHPAWVLFAVLAGGALFGFPGILLGVPVAAVIGVLVRYGIGQYRQSYYYRGGSAPLE